MSEKKAELRQTVKDNLDEVMATLNDSLKGEGLKKLEPVVKRIGRGGQLPHWYDELKRKHTIANLDGKTIGSILEMLLVAVLETGVLKKHGVTLRVNPARGIDLPDLDLGIKSPSKNYWATPAFSDTLKQRQSVYEVFYGKASKV